MTNKKQTKFWIALAVPFAIIILVLVKLYHTIDAGSSDPFENKGGMVFTYDQFSQKIEVELPVSNALVAIATVKAKSDILKIIEKRQNIHTTNTRYHWLAIAVRDEADKNWNVTFREMGVTPKVECKSSVNIQTGVSLELKCINDK